MVPLGSPQSSDTRFAPAERVSGLELNAEVAACLERCALYVGNDSGLMHLAAAAGIPTLGLFGPTPWREYSPAGRRAAFVVAPDGTMAGLSVTAVLDAAIALLRGGTVASPRGGA